MADDRLRFILDFVAQTSGLKNAQALAEELGTSLDDAEDAGKAMAAALKVGADKAQRELDETVKMADKLADALGSELAGKVNVDEIAGKMRQVGMTTADVEANIDDFRSSLTQMAATADQAKARMGDLNTGVQRVGDSTDRSRSVMANFTGNALQEIPGMAGAFGPLNMAIGQFAEYASEGNIKLSGLASTIAPIAGLTLAIDAVSKSFAAQAKRVEDLKAAHEDLQKAEYDTAAIKIAENFKGQFKYAQQLGISLEDVTQAIMGNEEAYARVARAQTAAGANLEHLGLTQAQYSRASTELTTTLGLAREQWVETGDAAAHNADVIASVRSALGPTNEALAVTAGALGKTETAMERAGRAWDKFTGKFDTEDALANAVLAVEGLDDALADIAERLKSGEISDAEAWAESVLAVNSVKGAVHDLESQLGVTSTKFAEGIDVLIDTGQIDEAYAKLIALQKLIDSNNAPGALQGEAARNGHAPAVPGRASGGPVTAGQAYVVGEKRPELFVPGVSGTILPSVPGAAGGQPITINVTAGIGTDGAQVGRQVADALAAFYRSGGQRP